MTKIYLKNDDDQYADHAYIETRQKIQIQDAEMVEFSMMNGEDLKVYEYDGGFRIEYTQYPEFSNSQTHVLQLKNGKVERIEKV